MENEDILKNVNIVIGLIIIVLSLIVIIYGTTTLIILILLLSVTVLFAGFGRMSNAITNKSLPKIGMLMKYLTGLFSINASVIVMVFVIINPSFAITLFINLFGAVLLLFGVARISMGYLMDSYPKAYRVLLILIGVITFIFAILVLIFPVFGYYIIIILISLALLLNGIARVVFGLIAKRI